MLCELQHGMSTAVCRTVAPALATGRIMHLGSSLAARRLRLPRGTHLVDRPRFIAAKRKTPCDRHDQKDSHIRTWGDKFIVAGIALRGAAMLPRFAGAASLLRFAGVGPMLLGTVVSAYELGGWKLIIAVPATCLAFAGTTMYVDTVVEQRVKDEVIRDLHTGCPNVPAAAIEALKGARLCQYETNRMRLQLEWPAENPQWRIQVLGERPLVSQPWSVTNLAVSSAKASIDNQRLPPQTRNWESRVQPVQWEIVWNRQ